jgi:hypothetical protein
VPNNTTSGIGTGIIGMGFGIIRIIIGTLP